MSNEIAYRTADPEVIAAWRKYKVETEAIEIKRRELSEAIEIKRRELSEALGRNMWTVRRGFGHGTRVVGFERFESDKDGDLIHHDGCLIVSSRRGGHGGRVVPNLRRKAGKIMDTVMQGLATDGPNLPGMPPFHVGGSTFGLASHAPELWEHDGVVYALWGSADVPVEANWENIPLSTYHLAHEQYEKENTDG